MEDVGRRGRGVSRSFRLLLSDSVSLYELYEFFMPLEVETAKVSGTTLGEASVSTVGQLAEFLVMRYANENGEIVPNKPDEREMRARLAEHVRGRVREDPGRRDIRQHSGVRLQGAVSLDNNRAQHRSPTVCTDCKDYFEAPNGVKFARKPQGIIPKAMEMLISERQSVKKAYKKDPDNKSLSARSNALKILANSFYGYLGYARSQLVLQGLREQRYRAGRGPTYSTPSRRRRGSVQVAVRGHGLVLPAGGRQERG